jgi:thiamine-phosphate pyrophosphorylase
MSGNSLRNPAPMHTRLSGLYVITDAACQPPARLPAAVEQALAGGARIVQYRDKSGDPALRLAQAKAVATLCRRYDAPLVVNDDVQLALDCGADGVHLGRDDEDIARARALLGAGAIIGVSCYDDWGRALAGAAAGADYVAFGSFFASRTKPDAVRADLDLLRRAKQQLRCPVAAIGGITPDNGAGLLAAGAAMLAVVRGVFAADDIRAAAGRYAALFS